MGEITIHTGGIGSVETIHIDWFDENNVHHEEVVELRILEQDKPRTLEILINGAICYKRTPAHTFLGCLLELK